MYQYIFKQSSVKCHNLVRTEQHRDISTVGLLWISLTPHLHN